MKRKTLEEIIQHSADALVKAALREIDRMLREGKTPQEILAQLRQIALPKAETEKLQQVLDEAMNEIVKSRSAVVNELRDADIEHVKAAARVSFPDLRDALISDLRPTLERAIAAKMGPRALMHTLKEKEIAKPATLANTAIAQFNNELTFASAEATGTKTFLYSGPVAPSTRPFCRAHAGKVFTLEEIQKMDNGQGLSVQSSLGGYNCRHTWVAVPDAEVKKKKEVTLGKQTLLMDESRRNEFFAYNRRAYVEAEKKFQFGSDSRAVAAAKALAYAHDGLNERITNQPADGVWVQRLSKKIVDGKKIIQTNFEKHFLKRKKNNEVSTVDQFRNTLKNIMRNNNAIVYQTTADDGTLRYIVHDEQTNWIILLNKYGAIETAYKHNTETPTWSRRKKIGTVKTFIGEF